MMFDANLTPSWHTALKDELDSGQMQSLGAYLAAEETAGKRIFPDRAFWLRALELTPLEEVRVVILGQDPYHGEGQAHGLCFSVQPGVRPPPSLVNIYKELEADLAITPPRHGFLEPWARQGVLLLNDVLTVEMGLAGSHQKLGWEPFTGAVIRAVNSRTQPTVFMLWGSHAQKKAWFIDDIGKGGPHLVLKAPHPSPLSAHRGFLGCRHFSKANAFLKEHGMQPINWQLPRQVE